MAKLPSLLKLSQSACANIAFMRLSATSGCHLEASCRPCPTRLRATTTTSHLLVQVAEWYPAGCRAGSRSYSGTKDSEVYQPVMRAVQMQLESYTGAC